MKTCTMPCTFSVGTPVHQGTSLGLRSLSDGDARPGASRPSSSSVLDNGIPHTLDAETSQLLKRTTKRDATTKLKALKALAVRCAEYDAASASGFLPPWLFSFRRLTLDNDRAVRLEAVRVLHIVMIAAGRQCAPHLRDAAGPWWLTMCDEWREVAEVAKALFMVLLKELFPSEAKQRQTLAFAQADVVTYLKAKFMCPASELGDPSKESSEELLTREARVAAQALRAFSHLVQSQIADAQDSGRQDTGGLLSVGGLAESLDAVWGARLVWSRAFAAKELGLPVLEAAFALVKTLARAQPDVLQRHASVIAPHALRAVQTIEPVLQGALWEMLLQLSQACPAVFLQAGIEESLPVWLEQRARSGLMGPVAAHAFLPFLGQMLKHGPDAWHSEQVGRALLDGLRDGVSSLEDAAVFAEVLIFLGRRQGTDKEQSISANGMADRWAQSVLSPVLPGFHSAATEPCLLIAEALCKVMQDVLRTDSGATHDTCSAILQTYARAATSVLEGEAGNDGLASVGAILKRMCSSVHVESPVCTLVDARLLEPVVEGLARRIQGESQTSKLGALLLDIIFSRQAVLEATLGTDAASQLATTLAQRIVRAVHESGASSKLPQQVFEGDLRLLCAVAQSAGLSIESVVAGVLLLCTASDSAMPVKDIVLSTWQSADSFSAYFGEWQRLQGNVEWVLVAAVAGFLRLLPLHISPACLGACEVRGPLQQMLSLAFAAVLLHECTECAELLQQHSSAVPLHLSSLICASSSTLLMLPSLLDCASTVLPLMGNALCLPSGQEGAFSIACLTATNLLMPCVEALTCRYLPTLRLEAEGLGDEIGAQHGNIDYLEIHILVSRLLQALLPLALHALLPRGGNSTVFGSGTAAEHATAVATSAAACWTRAEGHMDRHSHGTLCSSKRAEVHERKCWEETMSACWRWCCQAVQTAHFEGPTARRSRRAVASIAEASVVGHAAQILLGELRVQGHMAGIASARAAWTLMLNEVFDVDQSSHNSVASLAESVAGSDTGAQVAYQVAVERSDDDASQAGVMILAAMVMQCEAQMNDVLNDTLLVTLAAMVSGLENGSAVGACVLLKAHAPAVAWRDTVRILWRKNLVAGGRGTAAHQALLQLLSYLPQQHGPQLSAQVLKDCAQALSEAWDLGGRKVAGNDRLLLATRSFEDVLGACTLSLHAGVRAGCPECIAWRRAFAQRWLQDLMGVPPLLGSMDNVRAEEASCVASAATCLLLDLVCSLFLPPMGRRAPAKVQAQALALASCMANQQVPPDLNRRQPVAAAQLCERDDALVDADNAKLLANCTLHQLRAANAPSLFIACESSWRSGIASLGWAALHSENGAVPGAVVSRLSACVDAALDHCSKCLKQHTHRITNASVALAHSIPGASAELDPSMSLIFLSRLARRPGIVSAEATDAFLHRLAPSDWALPGAPVLFLAHELKMKGAIDPHSWTEHASALLHMFLCAGICLRCAAAAAIDRSAAVAAICLPSLEWDMIGFLLVSHTSEGELHAMLEDASMWSERQGVTVAEALVALASNSLAGTAVNSTAVALLLSTSVLTSLSHVQDNAETAELQSLARDTKDNMATFLSLAGVVPFFAQALDPGPAVSPEKLPQGWTEDDWLLTYQQCKLLTWSVLYAYLTADFTPAMARQHLAMALGVCDPFIIQSVLDSVAALLPLPPNLATSDILETEDSNGTWSLVAPLRQLTVDIAARPGRRLLEGRVLHSDSFEDADLMRLAVLLFRASLRATPATVRSWFATLGPPSQSKLIEEYTAHVESPQLLQQELAEALIMQDSMLGIRASSAARQVVASIEVDEGVQCCLTIELPACFPLKAAMVTCNDRAVVEEKVLGQWLLSIATFLRNQNCKMADAVRMWKKNVDQRFAGIDSCMICYTVIHPSNRSLPTMKCKTCRQNFHSLCLYKWFRSSSRSNCPHCQSPW